MNTITNKRKDNKVMEENKDYFAWKNVTFELSPCDADILLYAINHIDWSDYDEEDFGGESVDAACEHLCWFEDTLNKEFDIDDED